MIGLVLTPGGDRTSTHPGWRFEQYSQHGRVEMSRPDECTEIKIAKTIHRRNSNGHRPLLSITAMHKPVKKQDIYPMLVYCWGSVADDGSILNRHCINVLCLL